MLDCMHYNQVMSLIRMHHIGDAWKTKSMVTPVFVTPIVTISWLA